MLGGPPYYEGNIDRKALDKVLHEIEVREAFSAPYIRETNWGPDSFCTAIYISKGNRTFFSMSWHELAERNPKIVAASGGLTVLQGVSREEFLKNDAKDYQQYRVLWSYIRERIAALLPKGGDEKSLSFKFAEVSKGEQR